jgi:16S rRNA (cytosine967-C5)-methyltransferase
MEKNDQVITILKEVSVALKAIFKDNVQATKAIMISLKNNKSWIDEQKGNFSEMVYDITCNWRILWFLLARKPSFDEKDLSELYKIYSLYKNKQYSKNLEFQKRFSDAKKNRAIMLSLPDWLDEVGSKELGENWDYIINALNQKPETIIRVNNLKKNQDELIDILKKEGIITEKLKLAPDALLIKNKTNIFKLESFKKGFFEMQDAASQMVSRFLEPNSRMLVVDVCAGEGSKTLHIAALMKNRGRIIAMDTKKWKLEKLRERANKAGAFNIETKHVESSRTYKRYKGKADRVLLDVPCSGLGTLRRNPDIKWKLTQLDLERLKKLQIELLDRYCTLLKKGGRMVYSTCSIFPSEAEEQIKKFIERQGNSFKLISEKRYQPDKDNTDGFYMALIERN